MFKEVLKGLGVYQNRGKIYLYYLSSHDLSSFDVAQTDDGFTFERVKTKAQIVSHDGTPIGIFPNSKLKIAAMGQRGLKYMMHFKNDGGVYQAASNDLFKWVDGYRMDSFTKLGAIVSDYKIKDRFFNYFGDSSVQLAYSTDKINWKQSKLPLLYPRQGYFDDGELEVETAFLTTKGVVVIYHSQQLQFGKKGYKVGAALFDIEHPDNLLWRSNEPIWDSGSEWRGHAPYEC